MKEGREKMMHTASWKDCPAWLAAFQGLIPENLTTPSEIAAFEAELTERSFGKFYAKKREEVFAPIKI